AGNYRQVADATSTTFTDSDGNLVIVKLTGPGWMDLCFDGTQANGDLLTLALQETDASSSRLAVTVIRRNGTDNETTIGEITGTGLRQIVAPAVDLTGSGINLTGSLQYLRLDDIADG